MADTTSNAPGSADASQSETGPVTATATGRVHFPLVRWALAPRTTWQARRLAADFGPGMDARTAWVMARLRRHPDEQVMMLHHLDGQGTSGS